MQFAGGLMITNAHIKLLIIANGFFLGSETAVFLE